MDDVPLNWLNANTQQAVTVIEKLFGMFFVNYPEALLDSDEFNRKCDIFLELQPFVKGLINDLPDDYLGYHKYLGYVSKTEYLRQLNNVIFQPLAFKREVFEKLQLKVYPVNHLDRLYSHLDLD